MNGFIVSIHLGLSWDNLVRIVSQLKLLLPSYVFFFLFSSSFLSFKLMRKHNLKCLCFRNEPTPKEILGAFPADNPTNLVHVNTLYIHLEVCPVYGTLTERPFPRHLLGRVRGQLKIAG